MNIWRRMRGGKISGLFIILGRSKINFHMKTIFFSCLFFSVLIFTGCRQKEEPKKSPGTITKAQVAAAAKDYFMHKLKNPVGGENEGFYRIQGDEEMVLFGNNKIFIGKLDNDETEDAVLTYGYSKTGQMAMDRHLVLLNDSGLHVVSDFPKTMTIEGINSRMVVAVVDTGTHYFNSKPCPSCSVEQEFKLVNDSLVRVKN
jgi:hypothetical protein